MPASKTPAKPKAAVAAKKPAVAKEPAAPKPAAPKPAAAAPAEAPAQVKAAGLKLKDLLARVAEQSDAPKKAQRDVTELVLSVLGAALLAGEEINLPGFGRAKVVKTVDKAGSPVLTVKVKNAGQKKSPAGKEPLADAGEDS